MWYLKHLKKCLSEEDYYHILEGITCTVGRKDVFLLIDDDPSISRKHCILRVVHPPENMPFPEKHAILKVTDASKYGTFKNSVRLEKGVEVELNDGDILKFGQFQSEFKVCYEPLVITTSCLNDTKKEIVRKAIQTLCGHLVSEWKPCCTHLVMSDIKVTVKALCCLTSLKPIISPEFIMDLLSSCKTRSSVPSFENYLPLTDEPLIDKQIASFSIVPGRKKLFNAKTFVFIESDQLNKLKPIIIYGGGNCILSDAAHPVDTNLISQIGYCVIQPPNISKLGGDNLSIYIKKVVAILRRKKKRMIMEQEIGLAVVYCSTDEYCNPDAEIKDLTQKKQPPILSQSFAQEIYAYDTEELASGRKRISVTDNESSLRPKVQSEVSHSHTSTMEQSLDDARVVNENKRSYSVENSINDKENELQQSVKRIKLENANGKTSFVVEVDATKIKEGKNLSKTCVINEEVKDVIDCPADANSEVGKKRNENVPCPNGTQNQHLKIISDEALEIQPNGFRSIPKNRRARDISEHPDAALESLPRNFMKISVLELVDHNEPVIKTAVSTVCVKNFKKFKKIHPKSSNMVVTNFIEYNCQKVMNLIGDGKKLPPVDWDALEARGEFDWNSLE